MLFEKLAEEVRLVFGSSYARPVLGARSSLRRAVAPLAIGNNMGQVERRVHARTHGGPRSQVQCPAPYVDPAVVERAWEQKVPPCLLKGLAGLSMQSAALWRTLGTAVGEGARQVLGMHKFANGDLACSELGWRPARARVQILLM
jgi:hypothetical protein